MNIKLLGLKLVTYLLAYVLRNTFVSVAYTGVVCLVCGVKDWRALGEAALKSLVVPFLLGAPIDVDLLAVSLLVFNYIAYPCSLHRKASNKEKFIIFAALLATCQLPLDWDLETPYQFYPWPVLSALEISHTLTLLIK